MRNSSVLVLPVYMSATTCSAMINIRSYQYAALRLPAAFTTSSIYFWGAPLENTIAQQLFDHDGAPLVISSAQQARTYEVPSEVTACRWIGLVTDPPQAANRVVLALVKD